MQYLPVSSFGNFNIVQKQFRSKDTVQNAAKRIGQTHTRPQVDDLLPVGDLAMVTTDSSLLTNEQLGEHLLDTHKEDFVANTNMSSLKKFLISLRERVDLILDSIHTMHFNGWDFDRNLEVLSDDGAASVKQSLFATMGKAWKDITQGSNPNALGLLLPGISSDSDS